MDAYSLLLEKTPKEELDRKIAEKIESMNGFLTREAAVRILASEAGAITIEKAKLADIADGANKTFVVAKLERILKLQEFDNGKKLRKIVVSDESGERELKLWNDEIARLNSLHAGDVLEIRGIYCKSNELSLGYNGEMKVVQHASFADLGALNDLEGSTVNVRGYVESLDGMKEYEKDGETRRMFSFRISDGKNSVRTLIWSFAERGNELASGAEVKIENASVRKGELHLGTVSRLMVKKKREGLSGTLNKLEVTGGRLVLTIDADSYDFSREEALTILGAQVADDIKLETVAELKKAGILGKGIFIEMKGGKIVRASVK